MITATENEVSTALHAPGKREAVKSFSRSFLRRYIILRFWKLAGITVCGLISSLSSFFLTLIIGDFFLLIFNTSGSKGKLLTWFGIQISSVNAFFGWFILLLLVRFLSTFLERYLAAIEGERFVRDIRERIFQSQISMQFVQHREGSFGKYLLRYSNDLRSIQQFLVKGLLGGIRQFLFALAGLTLISIINPVIGLYSSFFIVSILLVMYVVSLLQRNYIRTSRQQRSNLLAFITRTFSRLEKKGSAANDQTIMEKYRQRADSLFTANVLNNKADSLLHAAALLLQSGMIGGILWVMTSPGILTNPSDGLLIVLLLLLMQGTIRALLKVPGYLNKGKISFQKIDELIIQAASD